MWIRQCRPWGEELSDVRIEGESIAEIRSAERAGPEGEESANDPVSEQGDVEGRGRLLLPAFADVHVHLDSTRLGLPFRPHTGAPGVWAMMLNDRAHWREAEIGLVERVAHTLELEIARGTTRVRSFAQVDTDAGLERLEAVLAARESHRARCEVQVIAFPQAGLLREDGSARVLEDALRAGADVVGGIDPCTLDRDPVAHLDIVFGLAEQYGVPVDIHLHEPGDLGRFSADLILERTVALGMQGQVLISHGYGLWDGTEGQTRALVERMADADVATATIAPGGQQRLPLELMAEHGVRVGLGQDGQRDYWSPYGNADMLDRTWQLAFTHGFRRDDLVEHALSVATSGGASIMDRTLPRVSSVGDRLGLAVGDRADLLLLAGETPTAAVMDRLPDRTVLHRGRVVADQLEVV
ncbi:MAG: amidohydrolase family protein [Ornithinimicrobium sp.]|uniref:amidohydrolase family protein n=1 Tax=Ornithinimicrobium sp. TaxID=1977084 RepID=UPI0026DFD136|nr:amidohydrolase family protein [Ornithinimicrobium sp.]MDO5739941.1 amidohydrolase family protein [Ornithinimicrobium sp.]